MTYIPSIPLSLNALTKSALLALFVTTAPMAAMADASNKTLVVNAMTELFIKGDVGAIDRYWAENYKQHNPMVPDGREAIKKFFSDNAVPGTKYEMGNVIAEGDMVVIHGRYSGWTPKPLVAVDIFRVENGRIAQHWDVLQEEVTQTASGNPMFEPVK